MAKNKVIVKKKKLNFRCQLAKFTTNICCTKYRLKDKLSEAKFSNANISQGYGYRLAQK